MLPQSFLAQSKYFSSRAKTIRILTYLLIGGIVLYAISCMVNPPAREAVQSHIPHDGQRFTYHDSGPVKEIIQYAHGKKNGLYQKFYKDGALQIEARYVEDRLQGGAKSYFETGQLMREEVYEKGQLSGQVKE